MKKRSVIVLLLASVITLAMAGCGSDNTGKKKASEVSSEQAVSPTPAPTETPAEEPAPEPEAEEDLAYVGTPEEGGYEVKARNMTGENIKGVAVREQGDEAGFGENLMAENDLYVFEQARKLCFKPKDAEGDAERKFDIQLTFQDDTRHILHDFPFGRIKECEIYYEDDVVFLTYEDDITGAPVTTKAAEIAAADEEAGNPEEEELTPTPTPTEAPREDNAAPTATTAPARPTRSPIRYSTPTTAPSQPTTAPAQPTTAPAQPTTAPSEPTTAPSEPTTAPSEPTTPPDDVPITIPADPTTGPSEPSVPTTAPAEPSVPTTAPVDPGTDPGLGDDTVITY